MKISGKVIRVKLVIFVIICLAMLGWAAIESDIIKQYTPWDLAYYLSEADQVWIRPGLKIEILGVRIPADNRPVVTFKITDDRGVPLDREGRLTPGAVSTSFVMARIEPGDSQYTAYTLRRQISPITGQSALQPSADSGGSYKSLGDGVYEYTFGTVLPADFSRSITHTVGVYASRDLSEFGLSRYVSNATFDFVPDGSAVQVVRDVVRTQACNQCHDPLQAHGGVRREVGLCILCHQNQNWDPDTGNTLDFKVMIHKIHMGEDLPSVKAGKPYRIVGFRQRVFDFSEIEFPQDIRNCTTCHQQGSQSINYALKPSRAACGSCHDDVDFASGRGHPGGPQISDRDCARCHIPQGEMEFDASVIGAHTIPGKSKQLPGVNFEILSVTNSGPGQNPTVTFTIKDNAGFPILPAQMDLLALVLAGPTTDYAHFFREDAKSAAVDGNTYTYTFRNSIPPDAKGTYAVGIEGYRNVVLNPGTTKEMTVRDVGFNKVFYVAVTDPEPVPRRKAVDLANCNTCHDTLALHGGIRRNTEYCVMCHNANQTDEARRPAAEFPPESVHFKRLIHKIHTGHDLSQDFTVYGFGGRRHNFNEVHFPGDTRNCAKCHVGNSYTIPLPKGLLPTQTPRDYLNPTQPVAAACLACHDTPEAAGHAFVNTAPFAESCAVCHKEGAEFAVTRVHAR